MQRSETSNPYDSPASDSPGGPPTPLTGRLILFTVLAVVGCAADLWTKYAVFSALGMPGKGQTYWIIEGYFGFQTSLNEGALFGIGQGYTSVFAAFSVVAAIGIVYWLFFRRGAEDLWLTVALGLIMGGIFGNLYDRLAIWGQAAVRDWILFQYGEHVWPNFNIADSLLVCGAGMLLVHGFLFAPPETSSGKSPSTSEAPQDTQKKPGGA
ncbi:MAG: signal peptidase II [Pirellulaceae bacterium]